jgi:FMN-dependent NADH-azoreductase
MKVLHVIANPKPTAESTSKQVTDAFFASLKKARCHATVREVDLYRDQPPFYTYEEYRHFWYPVFQMNYKSSAAEKKAARYALRHGKLFNDADVLVITAPMWNFSIPGILKAWMDQVLCPGLTFTIGPAGVVALHAVKRVILLTSSGGAYDPEDRRNNLTSEIKAAFGFVRIPEVDVAWADGQNTLFYKDCAQRKDKAIQTAKALAQKLAAT